MKPFYFLAILFFWATSFMYAQGPISGFKPKVGEVAIALNYANDSYDTYFLDEGKEARELTANSYNLFIEAATGSKTSIIATLPYISVDDDNQGLQDASLWIKYNNLQDVKAKGLHNVFTAIGLSFPVGDYAIESDRAIGQRATVFNGRLAYQYQSNSGWFVNAVSGIDFQLSPESAVNWPLLLRSGYGGKYFYVEGWLEFVRALEVGTVDQSALAGSGSSWNRVGTTLYVPITKWLGLNAGGAWILSGDFIGKSTRYNLGVVFKIFS
ncbi:hypothetical protein CEQ90_15195 [Lewinellaceae bacterium SD302]|nr:hypothetical protein CEQ90_15195 [Lewinellaceae bacterium SD302]